MPKKPKNKRKKILTALNSDRLRLYELAVQAPDAEVGFVAATYKRLRGKPARKLREDFCGTALSACEWAKAHKENTSIGLDLHGPTLAWGMRHNVQPLEESIRERVTLLERDVRTPGKSASGVDVVLAMNFSYWIFKTREALRGYFSAVRDSLAADGVFFLDIYGGYESSKIQNERRRCAGFTYIWEQASYNPITGDYKCHINFEFKRGPAMKRAFTYDWRLWTLPEVQELLAEAGFKRSTVYWEGDNGRGGGNSIFKPRKVGESDASFICYLTAEK